MSRWSPVVDGKPTNGVVLMEGRVTTTVRLDLELVPLHVLVLESVGWKRS